MTTSLELLYFGKLPAKGDFIRSHTQGSLLQRLDQWVSHAIRDLEHAHTDWRQGYQQMRELHFAFCGTRTPLAVIGTLTPSYDQSKREFPLISAVVPDLAQPLNFLQYSPLYASALWEQTLQFNHLLYGCKTALDVAGTVKDAQVEVQLNPAADYHQYLIQTTLGQLDQQLAYPSPSTAVKDTMIALGLLLQPVISQGVHQLNRTLILPLATDKKDALLLATFWTDLMLGFYQRHLAEPTVLLFFQKNRWYLLFGFQGAQPISLAGIIRQDFTDPHWVHVAEAAWIIPYLEQDQGLRHFSDYLDDAQLSLLDCRSVFKEVFLGL